MNAKTLAQRTQILRQMQALQAMEEGSLAAEFRQSPTGTKTGPYYKHQVRRGRSNVSQRISPDDAKPLGVAIANRQKFEALAAEFVALTVADTRQNYLSEGPRKILFTISPDRKKSPPS